MGSDDKAVITGFICRLCSRMNRFVVHIYGDEGVQMKLAQKINVYLPITVNPNDPLPKTVCISCIDSLEAQHELMEQFKWARQRVQRVVKSETTEDCRRHHSTRPPEENRGPHASSTTARTSDPSTRSLLSNNHPSDSSTSRHASESANSPSSPGLDLNPSVV